MYNKNCDSFLNVYKTGVRIYVLVFKTKEE